ncbi:MAG: hypothetical protein Q8908_11465 [Bacteroidota bacterium]|nr:hypothetical protein [Bacteroidota bacterium]
MRILLGIVFVFVTLLHINAQGQRSQVKLSGRITSVRDTLGISFVHIIDLSHPYGTISDENGNFNFKCNRGDTLQISAVGFENYLLATSTLDPRKPESYVRIRLMTKIYMLPSVTVLPFRTKEGMKRYFLNMQLPEKDKQEMALSRLKINRKEEIGAVPQSGLTLPGPATLLWDLFSREAKERRKYEKLIAEDNTNQQIAKRYNPEIVSLIIGRDDPNLIKDFMSYCNVTLPFLVTVNDYELYLYIKNHWIDYSRERNIK